ncbi:electron transport complex subunit RsxG [Gynuella sunshinyii]|uniref:Ion-translocating oxidoreductase complex subunit G n=1 Tax=Gynuella sunshinyii YC6258 TaxID=1445510 RepID=A0A0C5V3H0_9GAMM|nr:electron transport complex subunit RsxG [Gynuella sunshinyii]AJQ94070.1 putative NADH:ubiquinone oxidoreductase, subunit RnfG [Gynuella sunshinyii YC6258]
MHQDVIKGQADPSYRAQVSYQAGMLAGLCCMISIIIYMGYHSTMEDIRLRMTEDRQALLQQVLPAGVYDNHPDQETFQLTDADYLPEPVIIYPARQNGHLMAVAFQTAAKGYSGDIHLMIGVTLSGELLGVRVISHTETPGLGDKIEVAKDDWITRFKGHSLNNTTAQQWQVKKDGGEFDQFTGATITPRAVVKAVYEALLFVQKHEQAMMIDLPASEEP